MQPIEIIVIICTVAVVVGIVTHLIINKKKGKSCCGDCNKCKGCNIIDKNK